MISSGQSERKKKILARFLEISGIFLALPAREPSYIQHFWQLVQFNECLGLSLTFSYFSVFTVVF